MLIFISIFSFTCFATETSFPEMCTPCDSETPEELTGFAKFINEDGCSSFAKFISENSWIVWATYIVIPGVIVGLVFIIIKSKKKRRKKDIVNEAEKLRKIIDFTSKKIKEFPENEEYAQQLKIYQSKMVKLEIEALEKGIEID